MNPVLQLQYQLMCADHKAHNTEDPDDQWEAECLYNAWKSLDAENIEKPVSS